MKARQRLVVFLKELRAYLKLLVRSESKHRELIFYSAQAQYISFFEGVLNELCGRGVNLCYITSDWDDPILSAHHPNITPYHFATLFPFVLPFLDARVVVMTMPDLNMFHIRRSIHETNHVYLFHSLMSTHMGFRPGAFDHFDTILCAGPHQKEEIQRAEKVHQLKPKLLLETGYYRLEKIYSDHLKYRAENPAENSPPKVLIAPSGHATNITATCAHDLVRTLLEAGLNVIYRPHPMTIYRKSTQLQGLMQAFGSHSLFTMDVETVSEKYLHQADLLISDWSGVALEYAFGTERPVLFVDLPKRQQNPNYHLLGVTPAEIALREKIGRLIRLADLPRAGEIIQEIFAEKDRYREEIIAQREKYVYHFGHSSKLGADQITAILAG